jgi:hypothetical protein
LPAAAVAEIAVRRVCLAACGAGYLKFTATVVAETGIGRIIGPAFGALHFFLSIRRRDIPLCGILED